MKIKAFIEMDYNELEKLITKYLDLPECYEVVACEEWNNDSSYAFNIKKEPIKYAWEVDDLIKIKNTKIVPNFRTRLIMQDMVNNDILPEGEYLINVSW